MGFDCRAGRGCPFSWEEGARSAPHGGLWSTLPAAFSSCSFRLLPGEDLGEERGSAHPEPGPWFPESHLCGCGSRKDGGGTLPNFLVGCAHRELPDHFRNETREERSGTEAWDPERARPKPSVPGWSRGGFAGFPPHPPFQRVGLRLRPGSGSSAGEKRKTPLSAASRSLRRPPPVPLG